MRLPSPAARTITVRRAAQSCGPSLTVGAPSASAMDATHRRYGTVRRWRPLLGCLDSNQKLKAPKACGLPLPHTPESAPKPNGPPNRPFRRPKIVELGGFRRHRPPAARSVGAPIAAKAARDVIPRVRPCTTLGPPPGGPAPLGACHLGRCGRAVPRDRACRDLELARSWKMAHQYWGQMLQDRPCSPPQARRIGRNGREPRERRTGTDVVPGRHSVFRDPVDTWSSRTSHGSRSMGGTSRVARSRPPAATTSRKLSPRTTLMAATSPKLLRSPRAHGERAEISRSVGELRFRRLR